MRLVLPLLMFSFFGFAHAAETINASVGQVGSQVITARQVWMSNFYERWTLAKKSSDPKMRTPKADWKPALKSDAFNQAASNYMLEVMVSLEAENFSITQIEPEKLKANAKEFQKAMAGSGEWNKLEVGIEELEKLMERKLRAQSFMKFKTESAGVNITDEEAKAYYDKNKSKFGSLPFSQFKDGIKDVLSRQTLEDRLKDWFEVLKRKYRVRFLGQSDS